MQCDGGREVFYANQIALSINLASQTKLVSTGFDLITVLETLGNLAVHHRHATRHKTAESMSFDPPPAKLQYRINRNGSYNIFTTEFKKFLLSMMALQLH
jgi:hypothetical protein